LQHDWLSPPQGWQSDDV
jgi:hypothetical protein